MTKGQKDKRTKRQKDRNIGRERKRGRKIERKTLGGNKQNDIRDKKFWALSS